MRRLALRLPLLALAATPARAEDPATNAPAAMRRGVFFFPDGVAAFRGGLPTTNSTYSVQGAVLGFADAPRRMDGVQLDVCGAVAERIDGIQIGLLACHSEESARGIVCGGLFASAARGDVAGIELSAGFSLTHRMRGVQLSGIAGFAGDFGWRDWGNGNRDRTAPASWGLIAAGFVTESDRFRGVQGALWASTSHELDGILVGTFARAERIRGLQAGLLFNWTDSLDGIQLGLFNNASDADGIQFGLVNDTVELHGLQLGLYNRARGGAGVQIGLVNGFGPPDDALWLPIVNARF